MTFSELPHVCGIWYKKHLPFRVGHSTLQLSPAWFPIFWNLPISRKTSPRLFFFVLFCFLIFQETIVRYSRIFLLPLGTFAIPTSTSASAYLLSVSMNLTFLDTSEKWNYVCIIYAWLLLEYCFFLVLFSCVLFERLGERERDVQRENFCLPVHSLHSCSSQAGPSEQEAGTPSRSPAAGALTLPPGMDTVEGRVARSLSLVQWAWLLLAVLASCGRVLL